MIVNGRCFFFNWLLRGEKKDPSPFIATSRFKARTTKPGYNRNKLMLWIETVSNQTFISATFHVCFDAGLHAGLKTSGTAVFPRLVHTSRFLLIPYPPPFPVAPPPFACVRPRNSGRHVECVWRLYIPRCQRRRLLLLINYKKKIKKECTRVLFWKKNKVCVCIKDDLKPYTSVFTKLKRFTVAVYHIKRNCFFVTE